ncbi:MAG: hypothetical protein U9R19_07285 [Bacteroidota bacterium]|nr:hypothetical protein [Bacteroidota bacterium]
MKTKSIFLLAIFILFGFLANSQTPTLKWTNEVNTQYNVRISYTNGGSQTTDQTVNALSQGSWTALVGTTAITGFIVSTLNCTGTSASFTWGTSDVKDVEECNTCASTEAEVGYIIVPNTPPVPDDGWFGIKCIDN